MHQARSRAATRQLATGTPSAILIALLAALLLGLTAAPPLLADGKTATRQAPNSRVVLDLPPSYAAAKLYSGFEDTPRGISIVILEAPAEAYAQMANGFTPERLATRGVLDARKENLSRAGPHLYMRGSQRAPVGLYEKFFVLFEDDGATVLVSVNVPATEMQANPSIVGEIEAILASARTAPTAERADLFELTDLASFAQAGTLVGTSKVYTRDGRLEPASPDEERSLFIVAPSIDRRPIPDAEAFARRLLETVSGYTKLSVASAEPVTIDGLAGIRLRAEAEDAKTARPVFLHQTFLPAPGGGYYRMLGIAPASEADATLPEFERLAAGFRLLPAAKP